MDLRRKHSENIIFLALFESTCFSEFVLSIRENIKFGCKVLK